MRVKDRSLRRRQVKRFRNQETVATRPGAPIPARDTYQKDAFVSYVLVDEQQAFVVGGDDEAFVELAERTDVV